MKKWITVCLVVVIFCMSYFVLVNDALLFLASFVFIPVMMIVRHVQKNGLPNMRHDKRQSIAVKTVTKTKSDTVDDVLLKISLFRMMNNYFIKSYGNDIPSSGIAASPTSAGSKSIKIVVLAFLTCSVLCAVALSVTQNVVFLGLLLVPVLVFFYGRFSLKGVISNRKKGVESELLFFVVFCDIMDNAQSEIYNVFEIILHDTTSNLFPFMKKEALILNREVAVFGKSSFDALKELAKNHPSRLFTEFIQGYLTSQSAGGRDTGDYLAEKTRELHVLAKQKMSSYTETSDTMSQLGSFGLVLYPMFIVVGSSMIPGNVLFTFTIFGIVFIPAIMFVMIKRIEVIQPFSSDYVKFRKEPVIVSGIILIITIFLELSYWEMVSLPLIVWSVSNYFVVRKKFVKNTNLENSIPRFVRDMNQNMLSKPSFFQSFNTIQKNESYSSEFNAVLREIKSQTVIGNKLHDVMQKVIIHSWLSKLVINLLSFTVKSGIVTPVIMEKLAMFSNNYLESKREMAEKTSTAVVIGYMGPVIVVLMVLIIPAISFDDFTGGMQGIPDANLDDTLKSLSYALVIIVSFFSMMLVSKIKYLTVTHSLHVAVILIIVSGIFYYDKFVGITLT